VTNGRMARCRPDAYPRPWVGSAVVVRASRAVREQREGASLLGRYEPYAGVISRPLPTHPLGTPTIYGETTGRRSPRVRVPTRAMNTQKIAVTDHPDARLAALAVRGYAVVANNYIGPANT
jgi:hypothetical protein